MDAGVCPNSAEVPNSVANCLMAFRRLGRMSFEFGSVNTVLPNRDVRKITIRENRFQSTISYSTTSCSALASEVHEGPQQAIPTEMTLTLHFSKQSKSAGTGVSKREAMDGLARSGG